jgi:hypothetical protein
MNKASCRNIFSLTLSFAQITTCFAWHLQEAPQGDDGACHPVPRAVLQDIISAEEGEKPALSFVSYYQQHGHSS